MKRISKTKKILRYAAVILACCFTVLTADAQKRLAGGAPTKSDDGEGITAGYYIARAENFQNAGSWEASKREIDKGLETYPDNASLRYLNGRYYYFALNDLEKARYNLVKSIQSDDQNFGAKRLMVDIEDEAKRYSSAICYINELLEFQPYDRDLWRRKIGLYNKIGHHVEADDALVRLARIYPNDSIIQNDFNQRSRANWSSRLANTAVDERAALIESWLDIAPKNLDYYNELVSIYRAQGAYDRAIGAVNRGLYHFPNNAALVNAGISLLTEMGQLSRALSFAREHRMTGPTYNNLLREVADDARLHDPYEANGRLYLATKDTTALRYLLNTSLTRGYYDDAIVYLNEFYRIKGRTPDLLWKEYTLEKRFGDEKNVMRILKELTDARVNIQGIDQEYAALLLELVNRELEQSDYDNALKHLDQAIDLLKPGDDAWASSIARKISLLGRLGRFEEAARTYDTASALDEKSALRFASAYEEVAAVHLKLLIENEQYKEALIEAEALLRIMPDSEAGLRTVINMAQTLKRDDLFYHYAEMGYEAYPDIPYFIIKEASALMQQGKREEALAILKPRPDDDYINPHIYAAYAGLSQEWAELLLKERMPELALEKIDGALHFDPTNKELLYLKGLAYELLKNYPLAYEYQRKYYNPSNAEQAEWYQHMRYLEYRSFKNRIDANYTQAFYDTRSEDLASRGVLYSLASVSYSRLTEKNTYTGQISYRGVDGYHNANGTEEGGIGLEFMAQIEHVFNRRWSGMANISYGLKYFNKLGANISAAYSADKDWTPSLRLGYRLTPNDYIYAENSTLYGRYNVFILTPAIEKSWERIKTSLSLDLILLHQMADNAGNSMSFHYNLGWRGKYFFNHDNVSSVMLMAGYGTFPELSFFDQMAFQRLNKGNAMLGVDVQYMFTSRFYMGLTGTWNTSYNPYRDAAGDLNDSYRNIYTVTVQFHMAF